MKIRRCASPSLLKIAHNLILAGMENPGIANYAWFTHLDIALYWVKTPAFCMLAYRGANRVDDEIQMQILDAFSRESKKKLVSITNQTEVSAICFFGGAPPEVKLPTIDMDSLDINRQRLF